MLKVKGELPPPLLAPRLVAQAKGGIAVRQATEIPSHMCDESYLHAGTAVRVEWWSQKQA
jgi:hypothetical protein